MNNNNFIHYYKYMTVWENKKLNITLLHTLHSYMRGVMGGRGWTQPLSVLHWILGPSIGGLLFR